MSRTWRKKGLGLLALLALTAAATPTRSASASNCSAGDPWFFCQCARYEAQICTQEYQACGGLFVPGCYATYMDCRAESGIDQCE
jgi:hypothetical protein